LFAWSPSALFTKETDHVDFTNLTGEQRDAIADGANMYAALSGAGELQREVQHR
jgi:hypothetical protein